MIYKSFRINALIRIIGLSLSIFIFFYTLFKYSILTPILIGLIILIQIFLLFKYIEQTNKRLAYFIESIRFSEFTSSFQKEGFGSSFDELNQAFNSIIKDFQAIRSEKEKHVQYLKSIVRYIDVSIIAFQKNGKVEMVNEATKKLFRLNNINNIINLKHIDPTLVTTLLNLKPGENTLIQIKDEDDLLQLAVYATEFKIDNKNIVLATIKNIQYALEEKEAEAWQKLIRVLTHEIMNSITPIASLSGTINNLINSPKIKNQKSKTSSDNENIIEIEQALQTIHKRSTGLLQFVESYRNLTRIPKPNFNILSVEKLFKNIELLMKKEILNEQINIKYDVNPPDLNLSADEKLIEQVLINLIQNSIHSLKSKKDKKIEIKSFLNNRGKIAIQISDNGEGILENVIDKIFIPFFTTKTSGTGIGLSLSKQIMRLHGGNITAKSTPDEKTIFTLTF